jgi:hypothetical protein
LVLDAYLAIATNISKSVNQNLSFNEYRGSNHKGSITVGNPKIVRIIT